MLTLLTLISSRHLFNLFIVILARVIGFRPKDSSISFRATVKAITVNLLLLKQKGTHSMKY